MADRELRRMHRAELIEIIYALKQSEDQLKAQNAALTAQLQDRQLRLESAGSIAQAALELNNVFAAAQAAARKAQQVLGWQPRLGVEAIIESAWRWHREHPHGYGERQ